MGTYICAAVLHKDQIPIGKAMDNVFNNHEGRPHWGKYRYVNDPRYKLTYSGWQDFQQLRQRLDPTGTFYDSPDMFADLERYVLPPQARIDQSLNDDSMYDLPIRLL